MLHQVMMFRFDETERVLPAGGSNVVEELGEQPLAETPLPKYSAVRMAASVLGNLLVGAALLGGLLLMPQLLANVLGLL